MLELWSMAFFRHAVIGLLIISIASAMIGTYIVTRRLVAISGGITHACFGGLGLGYFFGINPILMAGVVAVASAMGVEWMSTRHRVREDSAIAVIWALGMAVGILFVFLTPGAVPELNSFLFGNVLTISQADLWTFGIFAIVVALFFALFYQKIVVCAFDPDFARVIGLPVRLINYAMTVIVAVGIVLTIRLVGVMLLMSMMALPQMIAELRYRRFSSMMWCSIAVSVACCMFGLWLGTVIDVPCSALIVIVMVTVYAIAMIVKHLIISRQRNRRNIAPIVILSLLGAATLGLNSCSLKKNTAATRQYTAFITRYNIYYNGDEHFKTTLREMERQYDDDYSQLVLMHPAEAYGVERAPKPSGSFTRSIEKAQKAIQLRSIKKKPARKTGKRNDPAYKEWLKRDEYNPFLHNAWMLMARSQYFNGDFLEAASTFMYVSKHFVWLPATVTEAKIWQARCYCAAGWVIEADNIMQRIKPSELTSKALEEAYYFTYADVLVRDNRYEDAIPMLTKAVKYANGAQKWRLTFLLGQLYERLGDRSNAYAAFKKVAGASNASYRTRFNARIKQSEVFMGTDITKEVKSLQRMTRYGRNSEYLDQIYYAIGNLYLTHNDTAKAIENYHLAIDKSTRNGIDRAIAQITLGNLYFDRRKYVEAQSCYAGAVPLLPDNYPNYPTLVRRSDVLDELARYAGNVELQDSLLRLSYMDEPELMKVIDGLIAALVKQEKEEAEQRAHEEREAMRQERQGQVQQVNNGNAPQQFTLNTDNSWYFYNQQSIQSGRSDFRKIWGSRKLEDDWRRRNKMSFSFDEFEADNATAEEDTGGSEVEGEATEASSPNKNDPHYPEYYLAQIPFTDQERTVANEIIQEGLYNMGLVLKDKLYDYPEAESVWNTLLSRYPDTTYRLDTYYNMYLMYMLQHDVAKAESMRRLIVDEFPDSKYGEAMRDPNYFDHLRQMEAEQESLYAATYEAYLDNRNEEVHQAYETMRTRYPMSGIMPKFMFLDALAYVTEGDSEMFGNTLRQLLERYPDTDITPMASSYLKGLAQGRELHASDDNLRGFIWDTRLVAMGDSAATGAGVEATFVNDPDAPHLLILLYPTDTAPANQLLYDLARYNFNAFMVKDFDLEQMTFGPLGLLIVRGLANQREAEIYRGRLESSGFSPYLPDLRPVIISTENFNTMLRSGSSFEAYFKAMEEDTIESFEGAIESDDP